MRVQWELDGFNIPTEKIGDYFTTLVAKPSKMSFEIHFSNTKQRLAIFVSNLSHCIYDILSRARSGEWDIEVPLIISNHEKLRHIAEESNHARKQVGARGKNQEIASRKQYRLGYSCSLYASGI